MRNAYKVLILKNLKEWNFLVVLGVDGKMIIN